MKEGEEKFLEQARLGAEHGVAAVYGLHQDGQADSLQWRKAICERAYRLLVRRVGFPPEDIIFDPPSSPSRPASRARDLRPGLHAGHASLDRAEPSPAPWSRAASPTSPSPSAATTPCVRRSTRCFLFHAIEAGLDMGIVPAGALVVYDQVQPSCASGFKDVILTDGCPTAADSLLPRSPRASTRAGGWSRRSSRLALAPVRGERSPPHARQGHSTASSRTTRGLAPHHRQRVRPPIQVIEVQVPLMDLGITSRTGDLLRGQMFLPQVVKSARVTKKGRHCPSRSPSFRRELSNRDATAKDTGGRNVMALGEVTSHDIGKSLVGVCSSATTDVR